MNFVERMIHKHRHKEMNLVRQNTLQIKVSTDDLLKQIKRTYPHKKNAIRLIDNTNKILIEYSTYLPQMIEPIRKFNQVVVHEHMVDCIVFLQRENMINYEKVRQFKKRGRDLYSNQPADII